MSDLNLEIYEIMNTEKKQWIAPQATEIEVNTGTVNGQPESTGDTADNFS